MTKVLTTREQEELADNKRRQRKMSMKILAKKKFRNPTDIETSDSEVDATSAKRRNKRRKVGDPPGKEALFMEQYHVKKNIEKRLDDIDYWHKKVPPIVIIDFEELDIESSINERDIQVVPPDVATGPKGLGEERSELEQIMMDEADVWAAYGLKGFNFEHDGQLPDGFHFDDDGNIVRDVDGKLIPKEAFAKQMACRKKCRHVFSIRRLIRNTEGRPLGSNKPVNGEQVAFSEQDGENVDTTALKELDYSPIKGRQIGSAEGLWLKERLFEPKNEKTVPMYLKNTRRMGGVKPKSVYIDNIQLYIDNTQLKCKEQEKSKPKPTQMVVRSDTSDDGPLMSGNSSTWFGASCSGGEAKVPAFIPEEDETRGQEDIPDISRGKLNIGSDDEISVVPGSMTKLNRQPDKMDSHLASHWRSRCERQGHLRSWENTDLSDLNMRTAQSSQIGRPFSGDDRRLKHLLQELYTDKKYFDHYLEAERLPTNAGVETRGLASHGVDFLKERAIYWNEHEPVNPPPPPSELTLRLSRMRTCYTVADFGMDSMMPSGRPYSADDIRKSYRTSRDMSRSVPLLDTKKGKTVAIDGLLRENVKYNAIPSKPKSTSSLKMGSSIKWRKIISDEYLLPGNVLFISDT